MALFHLLVLNFPYALAAWIYLFVFTLVSVFPSFFISLFCVNSIYRDLYQSVVRPS
jgi:hypothetical protein